MLQGALHDCRIIIRVIRRNRFLCIFQRIGQRLLNWRLSPTIINVPSCPKR